MIKRKLVWACVAEIVLSSMQFCPRDKHLNLSDANVEKVRNSKRASLLKKTLIYDFLSILGEGFTCIHPFCSERHGITKEKIKIK